MSGLLIAALTILADGSARAQLDRALSAALPARTAPEGLRPAPDAVLDFLPARPRSTSGALDGRRIEATAMAGGPGEP